MQPEESLFPGEAVCEILFHGEWQEIKVGSYKEVTVQGLNYVQYIDPNDDTIAIVLDRLIEGWKVDPKLVVLVGDEKQIPEGEK